MRTRKIYLILVSLLSLTVLFGCSNDASDKYSCGYLMEQNNDETNVTMTKKEEDNVNHTINNTEITTTRQSTTQKNVTTTKVEVSANVITNKTVNVQDNSATETVTNAATNAEISEATNEATENPVTAEVITNAPTFTAVTTAEPIVEPTTEAEPNIPNDSLVIKENVIKLAYGDPTQDMIDKNDAVYDTGYISNIYNTVIFGHAYKGFNILDSVAVGEKFAMNNDGEIKYYEVQKSGRALCNEYHSDMTYVGETEPILYTDFGYPGLILVTCDKQDEVNYRWIIVAKEIV